MSVTDVNLIKIKKMILKANVTYSSQMAEKYSFINWLDFTDLATNLAKHYRVRDLYDMLFVDQTLIIVQHSGKYAIIK